MDERDAKIISILRKDPEATQQAVANYVGITQPAVHMRIRRLKKMGLLQPKFELNLKKLGFQAAKVDIVAKNTRDVLRTFENCPYFLDGFVTTGACNVSLLFAAEDQSSLRCLVERHVSRHPAVESTHEDSLVSSAKELTMPVDLDGATKKIAPCGIICRQCPHYKSGDCLGCPATIYYRGKVWKTNGASRLGEGTIVELDQMVDHDRIWV